MKNAHLRYTLVFHKETEKGLHHEISRFTNLTLANVRSQMEISGDMTYHKDVTLEQMRSYHHLGHTVTITEEPRTLDREAKLLEPTDTWQPQRKHMKEVFEGYIRAKYGRMKNWEQMYNEGIGLLRDAEQPVYLKYIENFMKLMQEKNFPDLKPEPLLLPRFYKVVLTDTTMEIAEHDKVTSETMSFAQLIKLWPPLTQIVEHSEFVKARITIDDGSVLIVRKLFDNEMSFSEKE